MSEDLQQPELKAENIDIASLAAAKERIVAGEATEEDKALIAGFEMGADAAEELRSLDERTQVDDFLEPTEKRIEELQAAVDTEKAWGEDTTQLDIELQGHKDMREYLRSRDYTDENDSIHDAESGRFVSKDAANDGSTSNTDSLLAGTKGQPEQYADSTIDELVSKWAEAEDSGDKTTSENIQDALLARLVSQVDTVKEDGKGITNNHASKLIDKFHSQMMERRKGTLTANPETPEVAINDEAEQQVNVENTTNEANNVELQQEASQSKKIDVVQADEAADQVPINDTPARAAIEAAPDRLAIERAPEPPAIEAAPVKKAIEAAPEPEEDPLPELSYQVGMVKETLKHIAEGAVDRVEAEKQAMASMGRFKRFFNGLKFSTLFKRETERKRAQEIMEPLTTERHEDGVFSVAEFLGRIHEQGITDAREQEQAMLEVLLDEELQRTGDVVVTGEAGQEDELVAGIRTQSKQILMDYLDASNAEGLTDDERAELVAVYEWDMQQLVRETLESNPDRFNPEAFAVMADSSLELMEQARLYLRHENGRQRLENMLDSMKVSVGQVQIGPNSSYDTTYIEGTVEQLRRRRVGSVIGRASFVVGTWATGALIAGAAEQASQSLSTSGARIGAAAVGGVLLGPVGAVAGFAAGVGVSAWWGRRLARNRAMETVAMMEVKSGDAGNRERTELFEALAQDTISYTETIQGLSSYTETIDGNVRIRGDLSTAELQALISDISEVTVRLGVERATNIAVQQNEHGREINLFMGTDSSSVQTERNDMIQLTRQLQEQLAERYGETGVTIGMTVNEAGESVPQVVPLETALSVAESQSATTLQAQIQAVEERREAFIRTQGRRGAVVAGLVSGVAGASMAAIAEAATGGQASTIFDAVGVRGNNIGNIVTPPGVPQSVKIGNVEAQYNSVGGSKVEILQGGKQIEVTTPTGTQHTFTLNVKQELTPQDVGTLKTLGVEVTQKHPRLGTTWRVAGTNDYLRSHGGQMMEVRNWQMNGTEQPDGTELGASIFKGKNGSWIIQQDPGTAVGNDISYDLLAEAKQGNLNVYLTNKGMSVPIEMHVTSGGKIEAIVPKWAQNLFYEKPNGTIQCRLSRLRVGVPTGKGTYDSVATIHGLGLPKIKVPTPQNGVNMQFKFITPEAAPPSTGFTIPGVAFSGDHGRLYGTPQTREKRSEDEEPRPNEPPAPMAPSPQEAGVVTSNSSPNIELQSPTPELPLTSKRAKEQQELLHNAVPAQPLSPQQIIDKLSESVPAGLRVRISGQWFDVIKVLLTNGAPRMELAKADGTADSIELENFRQALKDDKVRFSQYLGTPDASPIVNDIRVGEELTDNEYGTIRITHIDDTGNSFAYEQLDLQGNPQVFEQDSKPRAFTLEILKTRIEQGLLAPSIYRGVQIA